MSKPTRPVSKGGSLLDFVHGISLGAKLHALLLVAAVAEAHHHRLDEIVSDSIRDSRRDALIALLTVALSMSSAFWVGRRLIRNILRVEQRAHEAAALNQAIMDVAPIGMMTIGAD